MNTVIRLIERERLTSILPILREVDASISADVLEFRLNQMIKSGYECAGIYCGDELIGICGIWTLCKYYVGKHLEPDNVYIKPEYRCHGIGEQLCEWLKDLARSRGCEAIELNCYLSNGRGRAFWSKNGFKEIGVHNQFKLA